MNALRKLFTKWYIKRGYTFGYDWTSDDTYTMVAKEYFICPWWVKPLLVFFSPSVYIAALRYQILEEV